VPELEAQLADLPSVERRRSGNRHRRHLLSPAFLAAAGATIAVSVITDVHFVWLIWPLLWIVRPWHRHRGRGGNPNATAVI
jgi:hypothetical protein